jgi:hypothetical protein
MRVRLAVWTLIVVAVVLATRTIAYALAPQSVLLAALAQGEAGPNVAGALVVAVVAGAGIAAAVLWLAVTAVRERLALEGRRLVRTPRVPVVRLGVRVVALFLVTSFTFAMTESYIHWRDGLGWHGLHCLVGPVHRDAIPILVALSLIAVAIHGAVEHLLAWARRLFAQLAAQLAWLPLPVPPGVSFSRPHRRWSGRSRPARGPPASFVLATDLPGKSL